MNEEIIEPNSFSDFVNRFNELINSASDYGIDTVLVLREHNRFIAPRDAISDAERKAGVEIAEVGYSSGPMLSLGMSVYAVDYFKRQLADINCEIDD